MKLTNNQLRQIIKEELSKVLNESSGYIQPGFSNSDLAEALSINIMHFAISGNAGQMGYNMAHSSMEEVIAKARRVVAEDPSITPQTLGQAMKEYTSGRIDSLSSQERNMEYMDFQDLGPEKQTAEQVLKIYFGQIEPQIFN